MNTVKLYSLCQQSITVERGAVRPHMSMESLSEIARASLAVPDNLFPITDIDRCYNSSFKIIRRVVFAVFQ